MKKNILNILVMIFLLCKIKSVYSENCPTGSFSDKNECKPCPFGCSNCVDVYHCTSCVGGYEMKSQFSDWRECKKEVNFLVKLISDHSMLIFALMLATIICLVIAVVFLCKKNKESIENRDLELDSSSTNINMPLSIPNDGTIAKSPKLVDEQEIADNSIQKEVRIVRTSTQVFPVLDSSILNQELEDKSNPNQYVQSVKKRNYTFNDLKEKPKFIPPPPRSNQTANKPKSDFSVEGIRSSILESCLWNFEEKTDSSQKTKSLQLIPDITDDEPTKEASSKNYPSYDLEKNKEKEQEILESKFQFNPEVEETGGDAIEVYNGFIANNAVSSVFYRPDPSDDVEL